jgi:hypothetical protein
MKKKNELSKILGIVIHNLHWLYYYQINMKKKNELSKILEIVIHNLHWLYYYHIIKIEVDSYM